MINYKHILTITAIAVTFLLTLWGCGNSGSKVPNAETASYDDIVAYLKDGGVITDDKNPADINNAEIFLHVEEGQTAIPLADWLYWHFNDFGKYRHTGDGIYCGNVCRKCELHRHNPAFSPLLPSVTLYFFYFRHCLRAVHGKN